MIIQDIYLENYDWSVKVYYQIENIYKSLIIRDLNNIDCEESDSIVDKFIKAGYNSGFTYSSPYYRSSIILIGKSTEPAEFQSTFDHEKGHLATHIAEVDNINLYSEDYQYLVGDIGKSMFKVARLFMCNCNENKMLYNLEGKEIV